MARIRITMIKSVIKRPKNQKLTLEALGLRKIGQSVEHEQNSTIQGMINKVNHLVSVETL